MFKRSTTRLPDPVTLWQKRFPCFFPQGSINSFFFNFRHSVASLIDKSMFEIALFKKLFFIITYFIYLSVHYVPVLNLQKSIDYSYYLAPRGLRQLNNN